MPKNKVIPQMFDVRPVDKTGDLDWKKIKSIGSAESSKENALDEKIKANAYILGVPVQADKAPIFHQQNFSIKNHLSEELRNELRITEIAREQKRFEEAKIVRQNLEKKIIAEHSWSEQTKRLKKQAEHALERQKIELEEQRRLHEIQKEAESRRVQQEAVQAQILAERKRQEELKVLQEEIEKRKLQKQLQELEKAQYINRLNEAALAAEREQFRRKREQQIKQEAIEKQERLKEIAHQNRLQRAAYEESVRVEREKRIEQENRLERERIREEERQIKKARRKKENFLGWNNVFGMQQFAFSNYSSAIALFAVFALVLSLGIGGVSFASKGLGIKGRVLGVSQEGYGNLTSAVSDMGNQNFEKSTEQFTNAFANFSKASEELDDMGGVLMDLTKYIPFASKIASGKNAVEAGKHFSAAGQQLNEIAKIAADFKESVGKDGNQKSLLDVMASMQSNIALAKAELDEAQKNIDEIKIDDLPNDKQHKFLLLKQKLPEIRSAFDLFTNNSHILAELLGANGPRKYLFLFQNNTEMRATGGFIGSYALLDISNGHVKKFFIDGIFNPDGQLKDKIVPPQPIQKISANWSLHDSNWFADFPLSAKKAVSFYEKTGGPTVDGVITLTPTVMQKLLEITGPIEMPEYGVTLDSQNFVQMTQYEVEVDYDKQENKPKKILSDLAPLVIEKLISSKSIESLTKSANAILEGFQEKHILMYSENSELQNIIKNQGWSGEVLPSSKDYISVINSNINGYKTDAVVEESITHKAEIQSDGSIVDTLVITRKHNGGDAKYEWLNKVNADYMRVYVPEGSKLLEVSGQTRELNEPPLDFDQLGFKRDGDVQAQEESMTVDDTTGTRIYNEFGKTVFANWVYVSPGESVTVTYKYILPFSLFKVSVGNGPQVDSYSLVAQKQSGSVGSKFNSSIIFPKEYNLKWNYPSNAENNNNAVIIDQNLKADRYVGMVFEKDI